MAKSRDLGVIFDMDGVLVDSAEPHFKSWQLLAAENDGAVTREQFSTTFGRQNNDIIPMLFGAVDGQRMRELADRKEEIYRGLVCDATPILAGAVELVRALYDDGFRLAVGSSGPLPNIELVLGAMGVRDCMSVIVSGDDVTRGKPDPQVFVLACEGLGLPTSSCAVIEDAPVGIAAARAAGTKAVALLTYHPSTSFEAADCVVARLTDLSPDILRQLLA